MSMKVNLSWQMKKVKLGIATKVKIAMLQSYDDGFFRHVRMSIPKKCFNFSMMYETRFCFFCHVTNAQFFPMIFSTD